jgi:hypothetical protein
MRIKSLAIFVAALIFVNQPVDSQQIQTAPALTYADLADLALAAPVVAHVRVRDSDRLSDGESTGVPAGHYRFLVEAEVVALIRGDGGLAPRVSYLVDLPGDSRGRAPRIRGRSEYLVLASRVPNRPAELWVVARDAQLPYAP